MKCAVYELCSYRKPTSRLEEVNEKLGKRAAENGEGEFSVEILNTKYSLVSL